MDRREGGVDGWNEMCQWKKWAKEEEKWWLPKKNGGGKGHKTKRETQTKNQKSQIKKKQQKQQQGNCNVKHGSFLDAARMPNKRGKAEEEEVVEEMERGE